MLVCWSCFKRHLNGIFLAIIRERWLIDFVCSWAVGSLSIKYIVKIRWFICNDLENNKFFSRNFINFRQSFFLVDLVLIMLLKKKPFKYFLIRRGIFIYGLFAFLCVFFYLFELFIWFAYQPCYLDHLFNFDLKILNFFSIVDSI